MGLASKDKSWDVWCFESIILGFEAYWEILTELQMLQKANGLKGQIWSCLRNWKKQLGSLQSLQRTWLNYTRTHCHSETKLVFPGMKILQYGFDGKHDSSRSSSQLHCKLAIKLMGTHDNPTARGWKRKLRLLIESVNSRDLAFIAQRWATWWGAFTWNCSFCEWHLYSHHARSSWLRWFYVWLQPLLEVIGVGAWSKEPLRVIQYFLRIHYIEMYFQSVQRGVART